MHQVGSKYTLVGRVLASTHGSLRPIYVSANWEELASALPPSDVLSRRSTGVAVTDNRSSWVRRLDAGSQVIYCKTYAYDSWRDRIGNWMKWTGPWRPSRARRECAALTWLARHDFPTPRQYACFEARRFGLLHRATLVSAAAPGTPADQLLASATPPRRRAIAQQLGRFVRELHRAGFRDRNLDLRNLIVDGEAICNIDSPRHRIVAPDRGDDALAAADWQRLRPQLAALGVGDAAEAAR